MIETITVQLSPGTYQRVRQESANSMSTPNEMIETLILEALRARDARREDCSCGDDPMIPSGCHMGGCPNGRPN